MFSLTFRDMLFYVNIVHMKGDDAVVGPKQHLCCYVFDSSWFTDFFSDSTQIMLPNYWDQGKSQVLRS